MDQSTFMNRQRDLALVDSSLPRTTSSERCVAALHIITGALLGGLGGAFAGRSIARSIGNKAALSGRLDVGNLSGTPAGVTFGTAAGGLYGTFLGALGGALTSRGHVRSLRRRKIDDKLAELGMDRLTDEEAEALTERADPLTPTLESKSYSYRLR